MAHQTDDIGRKDDRDQHDQRRDRNKDKPRDDDARIPVLPGETPPAPIKEPPSPVEKPPIDEGPKGPKKYV